MISVCDDCEYTVTVADLIEELSALEQFTLCVWISNCELPFEFDESADYLFLQEGIKVSSAERIVYLLYDVITHIEVML